MPLLYSASDMSYVYGAAQAQFINNYSPLRVDFLRRYPMVPRTGEFTDSDPLDKDIICYFHCYTVQQTWIYRFFKPTICTSVFLF